MTRMTKGTPAALLITAVVLIGMIGAGELVRFAVGFDPRVEAEAARPAVEARR